MYVTIRVPPWGYFMHMPVCSIVKNITLRCRVRPDALLHEANVAVIVLSFFLTVPWVGLWSVIVAFPDHTHVLT